MQRKRSKSRMALAIAFFAALIASYSVNVAPSDAANEKITLLIGSAPPDPSIHFYYYAKMKGFYDQEGVDVEFKNFTAETTALRALLAGEGEVAWAGAVSTFRAIGQGAKVKCISAFTPTLDWLVIANKSVLGLKDVAGKTFAVSSMGAASQIAPMLLFETIGVSEGDVKWVGIGGSSVRVQALIAGQVDATALTPAYALKALEHDHLHQIGNLAQDLSYFNLSLEIASEVAIREKPEALRAFVIATARGVQWALDNPDEATSLSEKILPDVPREQLANATDVHISSKFWNPSAMLPRASFDFTYGAMKRLGEVDVDISYNDFFFPDFAMAAAKQLGLPPRE